MRSEQPRPTTVDEYIAGFPPPVRKRLTAIRKAVRKAAPDAAETISYGIPAYKQGGIVVYFAAHASHIGMYPAPRSIPGFKRALSAFGGGTGTIQMPHDEAIPLDLIDRIVRYRLDHNLKRAATKARKR